ncbi:hypothetical protein H3C61_00470 [Candidatus Gracilibacteria bacterium]|nr:hypothetical protein [Candidatus Gracilibacteria bacterium]
MGALDLQQPAIIQQVSGEQKSHQEVLNSAVEQQRQTIIEGMKQDVIKDLGLTKKEVSMLKFDVVGNIGIITNSKGIISFFYKYSKENGVEFYTDLPDIEKDEDLPFALKETGYILKEGKLYIGGKEIPQFLSHGQVNPVFVRGIDNINFYTEVGSILGLRKTIEGGKKLTEFDADSFYFSILAGVTRIKDVMYFAGKGYIPKKEDVLRLLKRAVEELPNQCSDMRFVKNPKGQEVGMEVTKQELDEYLHPTKGTPLITQKMYDDCLRRIEIRDRKINETNLVKEQSKTERKIEGTRNGFVDRVKGILGF